MFSIFDIQNNNYLTIARDSSTLQEAVNATIIHLSIDKTEEECDLLKNKTQDEQIEFINEHNLEIDIHRWPINEHEELGTTLKK